MQQVVLVCRETTQRHPQFDFSYCLLLIIIVVAWMQQRPPKRQYPIESHPTRSRFVSAV